MGSGIGGPLYMDEELKKQAAALRSDSDKLAALEAAGVDNWEGYSEAMKGVE